MVNVSGFWRFAPEDGPPNLRGDEAYIEITAHELAHVVEIRILTPHAENTSQMIFDFLRALPEPEMDEHEIRALAIEVLGLHQLGYQIRPSMLARWVELIDPTWGTTNPGNSSRVTKRIEKVIRDRMAQADVQHLADVLVSLMMDLVMLKKRIHRRELTELSTA